MKKICLLFILVAFAFGAPSKMIQLSDNEKAWITQHPVVNFTGDPNWLPFEGFTKDEQYIGIVSEILKIIEQQTSLKFKIIPTKTWSESVSLLERGKVGMMTVSDAWKETEYLYTKPILPSSIVIVMQEGHTYVDSLYYLQYESIAVIKGYRYIDDIKKKYPDYSFYEVANIQEGLEGVASGKYDALLASMALTTYTINNMQLGNVKVVGKTEFDIKVKFAVRKELAPLIDIINKVNIGEKKGHQLLKEWAYQKYVEKTDYTLITQLLILLLLILVATAILYLLLKRKSQKHRNAEGYISHTQEDINNAAKYVSILDESSGLKSDELGIFFDDSFTISHPKNIKNSTFTYFNIIDGDKALLLLIDAKGNSIDSILNAMFIKTLLQAVIAQSKDKSYDISPAALLGSIQKQIRQSIDKIDPEDRPDNIGFDAAAITIDKTNNTLLYAGANIPLFYTQNHELFVMRADKHSVDNNSHHYTNHSIKIVNIMDFYLFTRGYTEQSGGKQNLPFGKRHVKEILEKYGSHNMDVQKNALVKAFREYAGNHARAGDITLIGFRTQ